MTERHEEVAVMERNDCRCGAKAKSHRVDVDDVTKVCWIECKKCMRVVASLTEVEATEMWDAAMKQAPQ